jgi:hypothetical protein
MASSAWVALTAPLEGVRKDGETASTAAIYSYLDRLPASTLARLFASPSSALAIFRLLPMTARHLVTNLLWVDDVPSKDLEMWFSRRSEGKRCVCFSSASHILLCCLVFSPLQCIYLRSIS